MKFLDYYGLQTFYNFIKNKFISQNSESIDWPITSWTESENNSILLLTSLTIIVNGSESDSFVTGGSGNLNYITLPPNSKIVVTKDNDPYTTSGVDPLIIFMNYNNLNEIYGANYLTYKPEHVNKTDVTEKIVIGVPKRVNSSSGPYTILSDNQNPYTLYYTINTKSLSFTKISILEAINRLIMITEITPS